MHLLRHTDAAQHAGQHDDCPGVSEVLARNTGTRKGCDYLQLSAVGSTGKLGERDF